MKLKSLTRLSLPTSLPMSLSTSPSNIQSLLMSTSHPNLNQSPCLVSILSLITSQCVHLTSTSLRILPKLLLFFLALMVEDPSQASIIEALMKETSIKNMAQAIVMLVLVTVAHPIDTVVTRMALATNMVNLLMALLELERGLIAMVHLTLVITNKEVPMLIDQNLVVQDMILIHMMELKKLKLSQFTKEKLSKIILCKDIKDLTVASVLTDPHLIAAINQRSTQAIKMD